MNLKTLAKDTALYGLSSIVGRFLSYLLVPLHTYKIAAQSGGYGIVTHLYAYTALLLALLTFGMETTLFRFSNKEGEDADKVYGTALRLVGMVALAFLALVFVFLGPISSAMGYASHPEYIGCMAVIVAMDAFQAIMFSRLRQQGKSLKFVALKLGYIIPDVLLNLVIFLLIPKIPALVPMFERMDYGVGLIFFANLVCTTCVFAGFSRELKGLGYGFDRQLARRMLGYSWPLLLLSLVGVLNNNADKILFPHLVPGPEGKVQLGIYGGCIKIAMIMTLLTQAFRYAYEPLVFGGSRSKDNPQTLADGMKYFIIFTLLAFVAVMFYMPLLRHFIDPGYWEAIGAIPIVMAAEIFMGIYFNLSFWYKLTDQTWWGAVLSAAGAAVMIAVNLIFVPKIGYWACAWGAFAGYFVSMTLSWIIGQKKYPIGYDLRSILLFALLAAAIYGLSELPRCFGLEAGVAVKLIYRSALLLLYCFFVYLSIRKHRSSI